jgi:hypothetical protein
MKGGGRNTPSALKNPSLSSHAPQMDPYDLSDPKDILPLLKKDFWEGLSSSKWSDRKAALSSLRELAGYPRLASGR